MIKVTTNKRVADMTREERLEAKKRVKNALRNELRRRKFWEFCLYMDREFFEQRPFLADVAYALQEVHDNYVRGVAIKVAVSMPPRAGKSYIVSLFCAWWLGKFPFKSVMRNTCTARLYAKFSYDVRNILKTAEYKQIFPTSILAPDKQNIDGWNLTRSTQVGYFGAGVGGTIIGFGANIAITDDLYKDMSDALSSTVQESVSMWKQSAHNSRMEKNCPEIFIGTRWTKNDEIGKAIDSGKIEIAVTIPALDEDGNSFCENVKSTDEYLKIKEDIDESIWEAEYQQNPVELKGLLFPRSELKTYKRADVKWDEADYKFTYVDPADTGGDDLSAPFAYMFGNRILIRNVIYNKDGTDITIPALVDAICTQKVDSVEVEGNSAWVMFGKELRAKINDDPEEGGRGYDDCDITIVKNTTNKQTRIIANAAFIKRYIYFDSQWDDRGFDKEYKSFMKNLTAYMRDGSSKHDDAPDSLVGIAVYFRNHFAHLY